MSATLAPWRLKLIRSIFGTVGLGVGILLAWAGYFHQLKKHEEVAAWAKTPCQILRWTVDVSRNSFGAAVQPTMTFEYIVNGKRYTSSNYDEATDWQVDLRDFEAEGARARKGPSYCYVNASDPTQASFRAARLWFPFSLIGGGSLLALLSFSFLCRTFLVKRSDRSHEQRWRVVSIWSLVVGGLTCGGVAWSFAADQHLLDLFYGQVVRWQMIEVPAKVEATGISVLRGTGRKSHMIYHKANLVYSYEHAGRRWFANRWYFDTVLLNGGSQEQARALIREYPQGKKISVWIHPGKPWLATLYRGLGWQHITRPATLILIGMSIWLLWHAMKLIRRQD